MILNTIFIQYHIVLGNLIPLVSTWWCRNQRALSNIGENQTLITFLTNTSQGFSYISFLTWLRIKPRYHSCEAAESTLQGTSFNGCFGLMLFLFSMQKYGLCGFLRNSQKFYALRNVFSNGCWVCVLWAGPFLLVVLVTSACICILAWICLRYDLWLLEQRATFCLTW